MTTVTKKTHELEGRELDYAVAKACGWVNYPTDSVEAGRVWYMEPEFAPGGAMVLADYWKPSTDGEQAMKLITEWGVALREDKGVWYAMRSCDLGSGQQAPWVEFSYKGGERYGPASYQVRKRRVRLQGPTPHIAAMRCIVSSKLGATIEMPKELP